MSRATPWITKPCVRVKKRIDKVANGPPAYILLRELGPVSFILGHLQTADTRPEDNAPSSSQSTTLSSLSMSQSTTPSAHPKRIKIQLGDIHKCSSCHGISPCKHILFVIHKLFRIPTNNALLWQQGLNEQEINKVLQGRIKAYQDRVQSLTSNTKRRPITGESCPICLMDMDNKEFLVYCHCCGNNIHRSCMIYWTKHRQQASESVTCPLCRNHWTNLNLNELRKKSSIHQSHGIQCNSCKVTIERSRYKCCLCKDYNLCSRCFQHVSVHTQHPFDTIDSPSCKEWRSAERTIDNNVTTSAIRTHRQRKRCSSRQQRISQRVDHSALENTLTSHSFHSSNRNVIPNSQSNRNVTPNSQSNRNVILNSQRVSFNRPQTNQQNDTNIDIPPEILSLQYRDITENDYQVLLNLDPTPKKGIQRKVLKRIPKIRLNEYNILDFEGESCTICLSEYDKDDILNNLFCNHHFHAQCIGKWLKEHDNCPICMKTVEGKDYPCCQSKSHLLEEDPDSKIMCNGVVGENIGLDNLIIINSNPKGISSEKIVKRRTRKPKAVKPLGQALDNIGLNEQLPTLTDCFQIKNKNNKNIQQMEGRSVTMKMNRKPLFHTNRSNPKFPMQRELFGCVQVRSSKNGNVDQTKNQPLPVTGFRKSVKKVSRQRTKSSTDENFAELSLSGSNFK